MSDDLTDQIPEPLHIHSWPGGTAAAVTATSLDEDGLLSVDGISLECACCGQKHFFPATFAMYIAACVKQAAEYRNWTMGMEGEWEIKEFEG